MNPTLGWAALSRSALKRAEAQLTADSEGMRDEVGVLSLHTGYANRFFPGTSVQQTRLRYALFVPWQIRLLLQQDSGIQAGQARAALEKAEFELALRLPNVDGEGTIGRRIAKLGRPVAIAPSQSYWVALRAWGILHAGPSGITPARGELFSRWMHWPDRARRRSTETDDEKRFLHSIVPLFHSRLPEPPKEFLGSSPLNFHLGTEEKKFLRMRLLETLRPFDGKPSYLAALVRCEAQPDENTSPWTDVLSAHADNADRVALEHARDASALAAVARAVYNAMVEALQEGRDGLTPSGRHREHLTKIVAEYGQKAQRLDLSVLSGEGVFIGGLANILARLQVWLRVDGNNPLSQDIYDAFMLWELRRKGPRRARLPTSTAARLARAQWKGDKIELAGPIEYRWNLVRRFLADLVD
jgi:hypothetical protein